MSTYELWDKTGDTGMLVVGVSGIDRTFRKDADEHGSHDERLITIADPEALLEKDMLALAAAGRIATGAAARPNESQ